VYTLNEEGIELRYLLTTNIKTEFGWVRGILRKETGGVVLYTRDIGSLNPDVTHEVTLGTNRDGNFIVRGESTNVIHTLRLHREVSMAFVILTKKTDLWITSDEYILGSNRHEIN